jgi:hypothetical protein
MDIQQPKQGFGALWQIVQAPILEGFGERVEARLD